MKSYVVGSGTVSLKYKTGIVTATDTQASYGNLCKFKQISRIYKFKNTLLSLSGEISDIQELIKEIKIYSENDPVEITTQGYCRLIQRILYTKRSKVEPLNVTCTVCGINTNEISNLNNENSDSRILCTINHLGNFHYSDVTATGMAHLIALPFLRDQDLDCDKKQAIKLVEEAMRIMCYRSCRNSNQIIVGVVDKEDGAVINESYYIETNWSAGHKNDEIII